MLTLRQAATEILAGLDDAVVVMANGYISRAGFGLGDRPGHFYMIGSMGLASSIGLGFALAQPRRRVVVLDGDGNVLMNLGGLATVAAQRPANFYHVVLDNEAYASTGNQPTLSAAVDLAAIARAAGYAQTLRVDGATDLDAVLPGFWSMPGPSFLLIKIAREQGTAFGRVAVEPPAMAARLRAWCAPPA